MLTAFPRIKSMSLEPNLISLGSNIGQVAGHSLESFSTGEMTLSAIINLLKSCPRLQNLNIGRIVFPGEQYRDIAHGLNESNASPQHTSEMKHASLRKLTVNFLNDGSKLCHLFGYLDELRELRLPQVSYPSPTHQENMLATLNSLFTRCKKLKILLLRVEPYNYSEINYCIDPLPAPPSISHLTRLKSLRMYNFKYDHDFVGQLSRQNPSLASHLQG